MVNKFGIVQGKQFYAYQKATKPVAECLLTRGEILKIIKKYNIDILKQVKKLEDNDNDGILDYIGGITILGNAEWKSDAIKMIEKINAIQAQRGGAPLFYI